MMHSRAVRAPRRWGEGESPRCFGAVTDRRRERGSLLPRAGCTCRRRHTRAAASSGVAGQYSGAPRVRGGGCGAGVALPALTRPRPSRRGPSEILGQLIQDARAAGLAHTVLPPPPALLSRHFLDSGLLILSRFPIVAHASMTYQAASDADATMAEGP